MSQDQHIEGKEDHVHYHGVDRAEQHVSVREALSILLESIKPTKPETVSVPQSAGRILSEDVVSLQNLPKLARSTRDGYAVNILAAIENDTEYHAFKIVGEAKIGEAPDIEVRPGQAVRVATGSHLPTGAKAVIMIEYSNVEKDILRIAHPLRIGENIVTSGEDLKKGDLLLTKGSRVHPQHIALFSMLGVNRLHVFSKPRVAIFSTGDELEDPFSWNKTGRKKSLRNTLATFDSNRPFLSATLAELGAEAIDLGIAKDNFREIREKFQNALKFDAVFLSAGSSVGERDFASKALESISGAKALVHGVAMRPSSPTGLSSFEGKPVILLPGFPTSAIVSFFVFGRPAVLKLAGSSSIEPPMIRATMRDEYIGKKGITHFLRVLLVKEGDSYFATIAKPTEAQFSSWLRTANGIAIIGENGNAVVKPGDEVSAFLIGEILEEKTS
jgi:molybdopterin molybdotransferase